MILIKLKQKIKYISQLYYKNLISKLNLNHIPCPICGSHSWYAHGSYSRNCSILATTKINIIRIKCKHCGSTHAILVEGMIPFTSITFDEAVDFLLDVDNSDYPYIRHFIDSYFAHIDLDYESFCATRTKNLPFCFIDYFST